MQVSDAGSPPDQAGSGDNQPLPPRCGPLCGAVATSQSVPGNRCRCEQGRTPKQANPTRAYGSVRTAFAISRRLAGARPTKPPTFAISGRHALAGWEVQPPLWLESPADPDGSTIPERIPYALESPQRLAVDAGVVNQAGAVSDRMSMRQPVSRAASRAFWPSRPMASESW
jgi:hypothetical protein